MASRRHGCGEERQIPRRSRLAVAEQSDWAKMKYRPLYYSTACLMARLAVRNKKPPFRIHKIHRVNEITRRLVCPTEVTLLALARDRRLPCLQHRLGLAHRCHISTVIYYRKARRYNSKCSRCDVSMKLLVKYLSILL